MEYRTDLTHQAVLRGTADGDVLLLACGDDPQAFAEVYRRYRTRVYGFCLARLLSRELAEDATQETFIRLLSTDTSAVTNARSWLFTVARNVCTDTWRQRQRERLGETDVSSSPAVGTSPDVADEVRLAHDTRNGLLALRKMRPRYRVALILREMHGLPVAEIAESMGVSEGAAHTLISRARDGFARNYAEISGRPESCADSLALLFGRESRRLCSPEQARLEAHLEQCPWCRDEARVSAGSKLAALVPLMVTEGGGLRGLMARIGLAVRPLPEPLRDVCFVTDSVAQATSRVILPLLVTASIAVATLAPPPSGDPPSSRIPETDQRHVAASDVTHQGAGRNVTDYSTQSHSSGGPDTGSESEGGTLQLKSGSPETAGNGTSTNGAQTGSASGSPSGSGVPTDRSAGTAASAPDVNDSGSHGESGSQSDTPPQGNSTDTGADGSDEAPAVQNGEPDGAGAGEPWPTAMGRQ